MMRVFGFMSDNAPTAPFPSAPRAGVKFRLLGGDVYSPIGPWRMRKVKLGGALIAPGTKPDWFNAVPKDARRGSMRLPVLPFFSFGLWRWGGYIGWKLYGFDAPEYQDFPRVVPGDVQPGAQALCFSMRLTLNRPRSAS